jgi:hypothetical protein
VRRCFAYLTTSLWSYHQSLEVWEPIMEPWQLLLHCDINPHSHNSAGIAPGSWLRLTSPQGCVHVTLAQAALNYCLDALTDWQASAADAAASGGGGSDGSGRSGGGAPPGSSKSGLAAADGLSVYTTFSNTLDTAAYLQLNYGQGRKQVVVLPAHATTPITQPMPVPSTSHAPASWSQPPPVRLVIDILDGRLVSDLAGTGAVLELAIKVREAGVTAHAVLWCAVLWCAVVCCAVVCCGVLCCAVVCCAVVCCGVLWCAVLCCAVVCCAVLCCAVLCCAVLCCAVLCCAVLCCAVLCWLCCAVLCCAVLCCAVLAVLCCAVAGLRRLMSVHGS